MRNETVKTRAKCSKRKGLVRDAKMIVVLFFLNKRGEERKKEKKKKKKKKGKKYTDSYRPFTQTEQRCKRPPF